MTVKRSTSARSFFDTNVLIYTDDHDAPDKRDEALELLAGARRGGTGVVSTQILQEYFVVATRKLGVSATIARRKVELFARFNVVLVDLPDILAAAKRSSCRVLYSEDPAGGPFVRGDQNRQSVRLTGW